MHLNASRLGVPWNPREYRVWRYRDTRYGPWDTDELNGIPVVFIPGHDGDYRQVRSLASTTARLNARTKGSNFVFYSLDFRNELSGLQGRAIWQQAQFTSQVIKELSARSGGRPGVVIGHSMGGLVARVALQDPAVVAAVATVITLGSPHLRPTIAVDPEMMVLYNGLIPFAVCHDRDSNERCVRHKTDESLHDYVTTFVSIGGGQRDVMVNPSATFLPAGAVPRHLDWLSVQTSAIPGVGLDVDHLCLLWCNQLVNAMASTLQNLIDPITKQLHTDPDHRRSIIEKLLLPTTTDVIEELEPGLSQMVPTELGRMMLPWIHT